MEVSRLRSQLSIMLERMGVYLQAAWNKHGRLGRGAAEKLREARCAGENDLHKLPVSFHDTVVATGGKDRKFGPQLAIVLERVSGHFQGVWNTFGKQRRWAAEKLEQARCAGENEPRKVRVSFHDAVVATSGQIRKLGSQLAIVLRQVAVHVQKVLSAPVRLGRSVVDTPRRLREARLARQNDLRTLLASSPDPVIVTNSQCRLIAANSQGLDLFGVSEFNMSQFTIGTFLSHGEIIEFDRNHSPFVRQEEKRGQCKIRRLDGTSCVAECIFVANVVPHQNLYRFRNITAQKIAQLGSPTSYSQGGRKPLDVRPQRDKAS